MHTFTVCMCIVQYAICTAQLLFLKKLHSLNQKSSRASSFFMHSQKFYWLRSRMCCTIDIELQVRDSVYAAEQRQTNEFPIYIFLSIFLLLQFFIRLLFSFAFCISFHEPWNSASTVDYGICAHHTMWMIKEWRLTNIPLYSFFSFLLFVHKFVNS